MESIADGNRASGQRRANETLASDHFDDVVDRGALMRALECLPLAGAARVHFERIVGDLDDPKGKWRPLLFVGPVGVGKSRTAEELVKRFRPTLGLVGRYSPVELGSAADGYEVLELSKEKLIEWTRSVREDSGFLNGGRLFILNDIEKIGRPSSAAAKALRAFLDAVVVHNQKVEQSRGNRCDLWLVILTTNVENEAELNQLVGNNGSAVADRCMKYYFRAASAADVEALLRHESLVSFKLPEEVILRVTTECGGSFRRAISSVVRFSAGMFTKSAAASADYVKEGIDSFSRHLGKAVHDLNKLKAEAENQGAPSPVELIRLETSLVECQEWLSDIVAKREMERDGNDWRRNLEELTLRLSPRYTLGALMRKFQKTVRDSKWASDAAKKKHLKIAEECRAQESSMRQLEIEVE